MGAPISGTFSWNTPNTATSGGTAVSADYNNLAEDVGLLYAKPWATLIMTGGALVPVVALEPSNIASPLFASSPGGGTVTSPITSSMKQNSPASGAGSFTYTSTSGLIAVPTNAGLTGMYRVSAQAVLSSSADAAFARLCVVAVGASGTLAAWAGRWSSGLTTGTGHHEVITVTDILVPCNVSSYVGGTVTGIYIAAQGSSGTGTPTLTYGDSSYNPGTSPPQYYTFANIIYEGSYGNV